MIQTSHLKRTFSHSEAPQMQKPFLIGGDCYKTELKKLIVIDNILNLTSDIKPPTE